MKFSSLLTRLPSFLTIAFLAGASGVLPTSLYAAEPVSERLFASPEEAIQALQTAAEAKDQVALQAIFGPEFESLKTGDQVQDAGNAQRFAIAMAQSCHQVKEGDDKITLEVGKEEIINRHIGKDELHAIGVCRAYVTAQQQYASANAASGGAVNFAQKFKSTPGNKDGLYWPVAENATASPFGPLVAEAHAEGYVSHHGAGPSPFHGYYFRILTRQGEAAPGGILDYMSDGNLTGGFALVAYPEHWDQSGIMTFIVNQYGKVYQRNLGKKSSRIAAAMKEYNPDSEWTLVPDEGVVNAVSER
jgi:hypothetical protein